MIRRWLVALAGVVALALAALVLPAAAQTAPTISLTPSQDVAGPGSQQWSIVVQGSNFSSTAPVAIRFAGEVLGSATPSNGSFTTTITPARRAGGFYQVDATQNPCPMTRGPCPFTVSATFRSVPQSSHSNPCGPAGSEVLMTVTGSFFPSESFGYIDYDLNGPDERRFGRIPTGSGTFSRTFTVRVPTRSISIFVYDVEENAAPTLTWRPTPCPTTTVAPTTTSTTASTVPPGSIPTTTRPTVPGSVPTTTLPPAIEIPPPTPGATLVLDPPLGPTGFVTGAVGTGFVPGPVTLAWVGGIGTTTTIAGPDGTFSARVLVLPGDRLGPRALVATGAATSTYAAFLVVPSTVQPSGQDVASINRIRRFNNR